MGGLKEDAIIHHTYDNVKAAAQEKKKAGTLIFSKILTKQVHLTSVTGASKCTISWFRYTTG